MKYCITFIVLVLSIWESSAYCHHNPQFGRFGECAGPNGTVIPAGESLTFQEKCEKCTCHAIDLGISLNCCGFGIHAGTFGAPPGCKVIADTDGCTAKLVRIDNEMQDC